MIPLDYLEENRHRFPDRLALADTRTELSQAELATVSRAIAGAIQSRVGSLDRQPVVAILLDRNVFYIATMFAAWRVGGYFVPLNARWPRARIDEIISRCRADVVICHADGGYLGEKAVYLEHIDLSGAPDSVPRRASGPSDLAYLIYTSGSTGTPKGVMISNLSYATYVDWTGRYFAAYAGNERLLITAELTFDITMGDIAFAFAFGTSIFVAPDTRNVLNLLRLINECEIDTFYSVPTTHDILFGHVRDRPNARVDSLKLILSGGDSFSIDLVKTIKTVARDAHFYNVYGPTELTINCFAIRLDNRIEEIERQGAVPIGFPFDVIDAVIVGDDDEDVTERHRAGRLCVSGPQVMAGYFADPDATEKAFVPDMRHPGRDRKLYDTGDLAVKRPDGRFYLLGRSDELVKVKGYRVHPNETTQALTKVEGVRDAATIAVEGERGKKLISFVITRRPIKRARIYESVADVVPEYVLPSEIHFLDEMPLNSSGKIDKIALGRMYEQDLRRN